MQILLGIGQFLLVTAVAFVALCALASFLRFQELTRQAESVSAGGEEMDLRDAFRVRIARLLGTVHRAPHPFCVMLLTPDPLGDFQEQFGQELDGEILQWIEQQVRAALRSGDTVVKAAESGRVGAIVEAPRAEAEKIARRVMSVVEEAECRCAAGVVLHVAASAGVSSFPENGGRVRELVERAEEAVATAEKRGLGHIVFATAQTKEPEPGVGGKAAEPTGAPKGLLDPLTGLLRPERVGGAFQKYVSQYRRNEQPVSLLVVDVDHLRRYNDHYGRDAGDAILKSLGALMELHLRDSDLLGRLGGEEFVVAMPCSARSAWVAGQRLVAQIKRAPIPFGNSSLRVTISVGLAGYPDHGTNARHLLEGAEAALSNAKENGGNMCLVDETSMPIPVSAPRQQDVF